MDYSLPIKLRQWESTFPVFSLSIILLSFAQYTVEEAQKYLPLFLLLSFHTTPRH